MSRKGGSATWTADAIRALSDALDGDVVTPEDERYDEARSALQRDDRPAAGRDRQLRERSTTSSPCSRSRADDRPAAGDSRGRALGRREPRCATAALVIDVRRLNEVSVDPEARTRACGAGADLGRSSTRPRRRTGSRRRAGGSRRPAWQGSRSAAARAGSSARYGLACDNLIGAEVVTAAGERRPGEREPRTPSSSGRSAAAAATSASSRRSSFRLHEVGPTVFGGLAAYDPAHGRARRRGRSATSTRRARPTQAGLMFGYIAAPPEEFIPQEWHGQAGRRHRRHVERPDRGGRARPRSRCATSPSRSSTSTARSHTSGCSR